MRRSCHYFIVLVFGVGLFNKVNAQVEKLNFGINGIKHHIAGHVHNPTCGTCQFREDDYLFFHNEDINKFLISINNRDLKFEESDFAVEKYSAEYKKMEVKGLQKRLAIYIGYDICEGKPADCHDSATVSAAQLPSSIEIKASSEISIATKSGVIKTPYPDMRHFYDFNESYGFVVSDSSPDRKTFFLNDTGIILINEKKVTYNVATLPLKLTNGDVFQIEIAFGLTERY
jgi:hypothetical protein